MTISDDELFSSFERYNTIDWYEFHTFVQVLYSVEQFEMII